MIVTNIDDLKEEDYTSKNLKEAIHFIKTHDLLALPLGKTVIDGDNVYLNRLSYEPKELEQTTLEGHLHYLDIQLVVSGEESIGYADRRKQGITSKIAYNPVKDVEKFDGELDAIIKLRAGFMAIVYPNDLHQPMIKTKDVHVEKVVVKVKVD